MLIVRSVFVSAQKLSPFNKEPPKNPTPSALEWQRGHNRNKNPAILSTYTNGRKPRASPFLLLSSDAHAYPSHLLPEWCQQRSAINLCNCPFCPPTHLHTHACHHYLPYPSIQPFQPRQSLTIKSLWWATAGLIPALFFWEGECNYVIETHN